MRAAIASAPSIRNETVLPILAALSLSHLLNDVLQSLIPAVYPLLKEAYALDYGDIGLITFTFQCTASLLQPLIGIYTDRHPKPFSLAGGMACTLVGLLMFASADSFSAILVAAGMVGIGSSVFHPEASRVARLASGGKYGFAQSLFQVGGNTGSALGPLLAASIIVSRGQGSLAWFSLGALAGIGVLSYVGSWYRNHLAELRTRPPLRLAEIQQSLSPWRVRCAIVILMLLVFSKHSYLVSLSSYYPMYLIHKFEVSKQAALYYLFVFQAAVAAGTFGGGPVGDRLGFKTVIWVSILGVLPFTLVLPYVNLFWTVVLTVPIGLILASAFSAIVVYAQELVPSRVGMIAGLFFGFAFGMAGIAAAVLGRMADVWGIDRVYQICAFLPIVGILTWFLPKTTKA